jgi:predicted dehydrogenase
MKVLIVGLGSIAKKHINAIKTIDANVSLFALRSSRDAFHMEGVEDLFSLDEVFLHQFDFSIISNPTYKHCETIKSLIKLDIPLFIEKPLSNNLQIDDVLKKIVAEGIITYVACNLRFLPCIQFVRDWLQKHLSRINEINVYCGSYLPEWRKGIDYKENYSAIPEMGGGVQLDLIHEIDYVYWLFGMPEKVRKTLTNSSSIGIKANDYANYCLEYKNFNVSIVLNYFRRDSKRTFEIVLEDGTIFVNLLEDKVFFRGQTIFSSNLKISDTYLEQMKYFLNCLSNHTFTFNSVLNAYDTLKICLT